MAFPLLIATFWGVHWVWGYTILYWIGDERERYVCLRFIRGGALALIASHVGWVLIQANWWGVLLIDGVFILTATGITMAVSRTIRQRVFARLRRSS